MKIEVHESALDAIKAMGQRDKERIEMLEATLRGARGMLALITDSPSCIKATAVIDRVLVNPYSETVIQKAE